MKITSENNKALTPHFSLIELLHTDKGAMFPEQYEVTDNVIASLTDLAQYILEPARVELNKPIFINSGYRCVRLNSAIGGEKNSQHLKGEASDISCYNNQVLLEVLKKLSYDQLIIYTNKGDTAIRWLHVSFVKGKNRRNLIHCEIDNGNKTYKQLN